MRSKSEEVIIKSEPGTGSPTGFFARTRDLFCTIVKDERLGWCLFVGDNINCVYVGDSEGFGFVTKIGY